MRRFGLLGVVLLAFSANANAAVGQVIKVLPQLMDKQGRHTLHPSLYERDAYQANLRKHPELCGGLRFDIHWKADKVALAGLKLRVEARGDKNPKPLEIESPVERRPWYHRWTCVKVEGKPFENLGDLIAWRVTLWEGNTVVGEQKSFLW
jgi:hypothetical protein